MFGLGSGRGDEDDVVASVRAASRRGLKRAGIEAAASLGREPNTVEAPEPKGPRERV